MVCCSRLFAILFRTGRRFWAEHVAFTLVLISSEVLWVSMNVCCLLDTQIHAMVGVVGGNLYVDRPWLLLFINRKLIFNFFERASLQRDS